MDTETFGFVGLGLIGGSLAKALKRAQPGCRIMAYTRTARTVEEALRQGVIDEICSSPADARFGACGCIFLCAPVSSNVAALEQLKNIARPDCILTDVGSVKTDIHLAVEKMGLNGRFIGGHPMTGSEKSGLDYARAHLFENSYYILTPSPGVPDEWVEHLRSLASGIGALPIVLDYRQHDRATAAVSHVPHLIAAALVNTVHDLDSREELMKTLAAGGFKDITRIASSSPEMWEQICMTNGDNIVSIMDTFICLLNDAREAVQTGDGEAIYKMFEKSRDYRDSFASSSPGSIKKTFQVYCDVVDESGAILHVAKILAGQDISIKNIGIVHSREFEEGVLRIEFYEEAPARAAARLLRENKYQVWER